MVADLYEQIGRLQMELGWLKKNLPNSIEGKRQCIEAEHPQLSVRRQCELLGLNRSSWHYRPLGESAENLALMRRIDEQYIEDALLRRRRMGRAFGIGRDRAGRLLRRMGLQAIYPKPRLSQNTTEHRIYPYLLRNLKVVRPNQVWASDIAYVPMPPGLDVLDGGHGLVKSQRALVAVVEHVGRTVLPGGVGGGVVRPRRKSSTRTRACSTPRKRLRGDWRRLACR